jgi:aldehyde dehydrogenase (NAD+)
MYFDSTVPRSGELSHPVFTRSYIAGGWSVHTSNVTDHLALSDPSTGDIFAHVVSAGAKEVDAAVAAARRAFVDPANRWTVQRRADMLDRLAAAIERREELFTRQIATEIGAPIDFGRRAHVKRAMEYCRATRAALLEGELAAPPADSAGHYVRYEAAGVAALITPWNWPLNQMVNKVAAAWAAGCSIVLKPSERVPLTALAFAECIAEAGFPGGMVNILIGDGTTSKMLAEHPDIDVISFTGSTGVGRCVARSAARFLRPITLELGGKSARIVMPDALIEPAADIALESCFRNSGQSCNAGSRLLVHRSIYHDVLGALKARADAIVLDSAHKHGPHLGPVATVTDKCRIEALIARARQEGAKQISGRLDKAARDGAGNFVAPTIFADVAPDMHVFREEVFGPVLAVTPFDDEAEAISLANDSDYGLSGYIHTSDPVCASRVACALNVGMVEINGCSRPSGAPFGGRKQSGIGSEGGLWGIRAFQLTKSISATFWHDG